MAAKPSILFIISADPRTSKKTAEAVRIAAGVGAWQKADVTIYLRDAAVQALGEFADELEDGDNFPRYLPLIVENGNTIYVQKNAPGLPPQKKASVKYQPITDTELARLCAQSTYTARF
jgi:hypothetical protein